MSKHPWQELPADIRYKQGLLGRAWRGMAYFLELWPLRLNVSWITSCLAVGGSFRPRDVHRLASLGITAVADLRAEDKDDHEELAHHSIAFLHLPAEDATALSPAQMMQGVQWIQRQQSKGGKVLIHCQHGVGRGPLLGCAALVAQGYSAGDAVAIMREKRWQAAPNRRQLNALLEFERIVRAGAWKCDGPHPATPQRQGPPAPSSP